MSRPLMAEGRVVKPSQIRSFKKRGIKVASTNPPRPSTKKKAP